MVSAKTAMEARKQYTYCMEYAGLARAELDRTPDSSIAVSVRRTGVREALHGAMIARKNALGGSTVLDAARVAYDLSDKEEVKADIAKRFDLGRDLEAKAAEKAFKACTESHYWSRAIRIARRHDLAPEMVASAKLLRRSIPDQEKLLGRISIWRD